MNSNRKSNANRTAARPMKRPRGSRSKTPAKRARFNPDRKVFGPVWKNCVIPSANRIIHSSTAEVVRGLCGFRYAIGDDTLFDGPFQFLRSMHEFRVHKVEFNVTVICTPKNVYATHPFEVSSIVIPVDTDADDTTDFKSFEHAMEHPGARTSVSLSDKVANHKFTWMPTEPSDQEWRLVKNDNIVYLYVFFRYTETILQKFSIDTIVRAKVHLNFRGVNFDGKAALCAYAVRPTEDSPPTSSSTLDFDMMDVQLPRLQIGSASLRQ